MTPGTAEGDEAVGCQSVEVPADHHQLQLPGDPRPPPVETVGEVHRDQHVVLLVVRSAEHHDGGVRHQ